MKVSTKGRYALRLMIDLANNNNGEYISLKDISERQEISMKYLEQIVTPLCRVNYIRSTRGAQGGYKLAKDPSLYTAGDILRVFEGNMAPIACLESDVNDCPRIQTCSTIEFWEGLYNVIKKYIDSITLEDLLISYKKKQSIDFNI